jgi:hypothetical protein
VRRRRPSEKSLIELDPFALLLCQILGLAFGAHPAVLRIVHPMAAPHAGHNHRCLTSSVGSAGTGVNRWSVVHHLCTVRPFDLDVEPCARLAGGGHRRDWRAWAVPAVQALRTSGPSTRSCGRPQCRHHYARRVEHAGTTQRSEAVGGSPCSGELSTGWGSSKMISDRCTDTNRRVLIKGVGENLLPAARAWGL